jgi:hypothetical protein
LQQDHISYLDNIEYLKRVGDRARWWDNYFSNFTTKLPGGCVRLINEEVRKHCGEEAVEKVNRSKIRQNYSERRRGMTFWQFCSDIDATIQEAGLDIDRILSLQSDMYNGSQTARRELLGYVFPVYVGLRAKGYNQHPDLTA